LVLKELERLNDNYDKMRWYWPEICGFKPKLTEVKNVEKIGYCTERLDWKK
jgi:hypothetical protein